MNFLRTFYAWYRIVHLRSTSWHETKVSSRKSWSETFPYQLFSSTQFPISRQSFPLFYFIHLAGGEEQWVAAVMFVCLPPADANIILCTEPQRCTDDRKWRQAASPLWYSVYSNRKPSLCTLAFVNSYPNQHRLCATRRSWDEYCRNKRIDHVGASPCWWKIPHQPAAVETTYLGQVDASLPSMRPSHLPNFPLYHQSFLQDLGALKFRTSPPDYFPLKRSTRIPLAMMWRWAPFGIMGRPKPRTLTMSQLPRWNCSRPF